MEQYFGRILFILFIFPQFTLVEKVNTIPPPTIIDRISSYAKNVIQKVDLTNSSDKYLLNNTVTFLTSFMRMLPDYSNKIEEYEKIHPRKQNESAFHHVLSYLYPGTKIMVESLEDHDPEQRETIKSILNFTFFESIGEEFFSDILPEFKQKVREYFSKHKRSSNESILEYVCETAPGFLEDVKKYANQKFRTDVDKISHDMNRKITHIEDFIQWNKLKKLCAALNMMKLGKADSQDVISKHYKRKVLVWVIVSIALGLITLVLVCILIARYVIRRRKLESSNMIQQEQTTSRYQVIQ